MKPHQYRGKATDHLTFANVLAWLRGKEPSDLVCIDRFQQDLNPLAYFLNSHSGFHSAHVAGLQYSWMEGNEYHRRDSPRWVARFIQVLTGNQLRPNSVTAMEALAALRLARQTWYAPRGLLD